MSGIAGVIRLDGGAATAQEIDAMLQTMARRGPDRRTLACQGEAGFGQALLATTPEALAECQPWRHPASGCIVVSDSRLDNRPQLLRALGIDRPADGVGDGELLHAAWQHWQEDCADQLRGDFAFALWDPARRELFMARDPMGVRPLAFHFAPGRLFVFGSVADVVVAHPEVPRELDEGRIADALIGGCEGIDTSSTFHAAVERLPPAHWLRLRDGRLDRRRYWRPVTRQRPDNLPRDEQEWIAAQREYLDRAVRQRLRSHRPVGSMLSGGLDSSSVVALAAIAGHEAGQPPLPVFSAIHAGNPACSETRAIRGMANHVRCAPTFVDVAAFEHSDMRTHRLWEEAAEPFDANMPLLAALYEAAAARGVASLMDGVPADNLYVTGHHARHLFKQGQWAQAWQAAVTQWDVPWARFPRIRAIGVMAGCLVPRRLHALRNQLDATREYRSLLRNSLIHRQFAARVNARQRYRDYRHTIGDSHQWHHAEEALSPMAAPYITAGLERYNRVAALHGIEPRVPYADRDLIEFQAWMPLALRTRNGYRKWVLRQAMAADLPADITWRRDKHHIGPQFNQVLLHRAIASGQPALLPEIAGWLDAERMAKAVQVPGNQAHGGLQAALTMLAWQRRLQQHAQRQANGDADGDPG